MFSGYRPIDCDLHPMVPGMAALTPYMDAFWADQVRERGITTLDSQSWPVNSPKTIRADWRGPGRHPVVQRAAKGRTVTRLPAAVLT